MKNVLGFLMLCLILLSCNSTEKKRLDVPWYVKEKITNERVFNYSYLDSLNKYEAINPDEIENRANYYSYLSNLIFEADTNRREEARQYLEKSFELDAPKFCEELIFESYEYLKPNGRPHRRYTMPFILDMDLDYFLEKCTACQSLDNEQFVFEEELMLRMYYIMLKDQWFRVPSRKANPEKQRMYDAENRKAIGELFEKFPFSKENKNKALRSNIYTLLLHSTDCDWTEKWLKKYIKQYRGYEKYVKHLKHFLWRNSCINEELKSIVNEEITNS